MVAVVSWSLGHASTVGIVYVFYNINLFFGINIYAGIKSIRPVRIGPIKFILFIKIPRFFSVYSGINCENKFYTNNGSHPITSLKNKRTTPGIPTWSPTVVLTWPDSA